MLKWLSQWLKKFWQWFSRSKQASSVGSRAEQKIVRPLPELTNADLEFLFTQLLEGVYQERGQEWALKYLQRMEHRISNQRWLEWLGGFGDRLLASRAPNHDLATRMVQLGELDIGEIGDCAYDIGIRLLTRNVEEVIQKSHKLDGVTTVLEEEDTQQFIANIWEDTPNSEETLQFQPQLWDYSDSDTSSTQPQTTDSETPNFQELETEEFQPQVWDYSDSDTSSTQPQTTDSETANFQELETEEFQPQLWDYSDSDTSSTQPQTTDSETPNFQELQTEEFQPQIWDYSSPDTSSTQPQTTDSETANFQELETEESQPQLWDYSAPDTSSTQPQTTDSETPNFQESQTEELQPQIWEYSSPDISSTQPQTTDSETANFQELETEEFQPQVWDYSDSDTSSTQPQTTDSETANFQELETEELQPQIWEYSSPDTSSTQPQTTDSETPNFQESQTEELQQGEDDTQEVEATIAPREETGTQLDHQLTAPQVKIDNDSLTNVQPNVALTLDELMARLQQSANLVQELAFGLVNTENTQTENIQRLQNQVYELSNHTEAEKWFYQGLQQAKTGNLSAALTSYDQAIALQPDAYEYWFNRGLTLFYLGHLQQALTSYEQAISIKPDFYKAWYNKSLVLGELGRLPEAINALDKVIAIEPEYHQAWSDRGLLLCKLGRLEEAISSFDQGLKIQPQDAETWCYRGIALAERGEIPAAIKSYRQALQLKPDLDFCWYYLGMALVNLGHPEDAIAYYDRAIEINPDYYQAWCERSKLLYNLGHYNEALTASSTAVEIKPDYDWGWYYQGLALSGLGRLESAIASYNKVIEITPNFYLAWLNRGVAMSNLGQWETGIINLEQAIAINPHSYEAWYYHGSALDKLGQWQLAIASYERAAEINPDYHEAWIDKGVALIQLGKLEEAIASWDKALELKPDFYLAWYNRGVALDNLKRYQQAVSSYDQAVSIQPDFDLAWYNRGVALYSLGQFEAAIASYDKALELKPDYWEAWMRRGSAAQKSPMYDSSLSCETLLNAHNPSLKERGYAGKLASYQEGLQHLSQDTHPEGWGRLHLAMGNVFYDYGKINATHRDNWRQAVAEYELALTTLTPQDFPQLHLEVLQSLIKALLGLGEIPAAETLHQQGMEIWRQLLTQPNVSNDSKKQLALKFATFGQLAVDMAVQVGEFVSAWEIAEQGKNACLTWQLFDWSDEIVSPSYRSVQQLLDPTTAIIYWHISPYALQTFVIKHNYSEPMYIFRPMLNIGSENAPPLPEAVQRLIDFENWVEDWNQQYQEYCRITDKQQQNNHSWCVDMEERLKHLKHILNIANIKNEIQEITKLILIPHRDLYRFPLHALFHLDSDDQEEFSSNNSNYQITYLPTAQMGLSWQNKTPKITQQQRLLMVENPHSAGYPPLEFAKLEAEAISEMFVNCLRIQEGKATKYQVEVALNSNYNIFHFTGYGSDNISNPQESVLALAGEEKLTLAELSQYHLANYQLVTISVGKTVITQKQNITSEYVGFVSSFLSQGVPYVVDSLWLVESPARTLLMIEFYRRLQTEKSPVTALQEAIIWLKELTARELKIWYENLLSELSVAEAKIWADLAAEIHRVGQFYPTQKLFAHPYYWAGFKISGNW